MKYLPIALIAVLFASCAVIPAFDVPGCTSPEDAGAWIDLNIKYQNTDGIIDSPSDTVARGDGNCIDKALLCLAMVSQSVGIEGKLIMYKTPYGDHATAQFDGFEFGYIEGSRQVGRPFSYRDAMSLIGKSNQLMVW